MEQKNELWMYALKQCLAQQDLILKKFEIFSQFLDPRVLTVHIYNITRICKWQQIVVTIANEYTLVYLHHSNLINE